MAIVFDITRIFEIPERGLGFFNDDGELSFVIASGDDDPVGTPAPVNSRYFRTNGQIWQKNGAGNNDWLDISANSGVVGRIWSASVGESGSVRNEFLDNPADGKVTNRTPIVVPYMSKLVAMTFSNADNNADTDIYVYRVPWNQGSGPNPAETAFPPWQLRDTRIARRTDFSDVVFDAGDKIAVYLRDVGVNPDQVQITFFFQILEDNSVNLKEQYQGNIRDQFTNDDDDDD